MSRTLELPDELAEALTGDASRLGISMPDHAVRLLISARESATAAAASPTTVRNGADLVAYWQKEGLIGSRPEIGDSSAYARSLRDQAQRRGDR